MNDIEKAIHWLRREKYFRKGHEPTDYIDLAIKELEKQISKKVINREFCPDCKKYLNIEWAEQEYCDNCGQKLDWSEVQK